ncbi:TPA: restriction endonuclease subunit S [Streptococcus suis]|nr:restriction endonuclease subunit S [Streptococcus suis]
MKTNNNIPAYRFQGYTDAWELRKLGELGTVAMCRRIFKEQTSEIGEIPFYKIGTFGGTPDAFISKELFEEYRNKYSYPTKGDILISASGSIGRTVEFLGKDEYFQDSNIVWLKHDGKIDNIFLKQFYSIVKWSGVEGSTIKRLYNENILNTEIVLPTLPEQKAIGTFFSTLDQQITLHQRKLDTLKEQKKTYLKLLFPAKGQTKPALRFQGFEDDWEEVKLGEILKERNEQIAENEEYPLMSFVQGVGVTPKGERYDRSFLVKEDNKKYKKTELGDFIYSSNNLETGSIGFNKTGKAVISPVYSIFYSKDEFESSFIGILSQRKDFIAKMIKFRQGVVYGQWRIHENDFLQIILHIPTKAEMEKIITFFQTLDQEIAQVEDKLASLKDMKKTLLRKLFV